MSDAHKTLYEQLQAQYLQPDVDASLPPYGFLEVAHSAASSKSPMPPPSSRLQHKTLGEQSLPWQLVHSLVMNSIHMRTALNAAARQNTPHNALHDLDHVLFNFAGYLESNARKLSLVNPNEADSVELARLAGELSVLRGDGLKTEPDCIKHAVRRGVLEASTLLDRRRRGITATTTTNSLERQPRVQPPQSSTAPLPTTSPETWGSDDDDDDDDC